MTTSRDFGPPERRECIDCGTVRDVAEFFTAHAEICDDCHAEIEQDWGGDHIADTNREGKAN